MLAMLYWQILGTKYQMNYFTKVAFARINGSIEQLLGRIPVPMVLTVYRKITGFLYGMVDPERMRAAQAQAAAAGGGAGAGAGAGSQRRCVIM